jgi:diadenylate cyclase
MTLFLQRLWQNPLLNVLDVALVAYLIYRVLLLFQGTRAVQVLRGLVILAVGTFVADQLFHLPTLGWVLRTFWRAGVVVLAVVFQPGGD